MFLQGISQSFFFKGRFSVWITEPAGGTGPVFFTGGLGGRADIDGHLLAVAQNAPSSALDPGFCPGPGCHTRLQ